MTVHFLDVGQGDCQIIVTGETVTIIDTGEPENFPLILSYIDWLGVDYIDNLILSHPHSDHMGAAPELVQNIDVKNIFIFAKEADRKTLLYQNLITAVNSKIPPDTKNTQVYQPYDLQQLDIGSNAKITFFVPNYPDSDNANDYSVISYLSHYKNNAIFTGDIEAKTEKLLLKNRYELSADLLKVAHHGSNTSSTPEFLEAVSPKIAVIQSAYDSVFRHPSKNSMERLTKLSTPPVIYRTALEGNMIFSSDRETESFVLLDEDNISYNNVE